MDAWKQRHPPLTTVRASQRTLPLHAITECHKNIRHFLFGCVLVFSGASQDMANTSKRAMLLNNWEVHRLTTRVE